MGVSCMCLTKNEARLKLKEFAKDTSKIKLSSHARQRMKERSISFKQIICCFEYGNITEGPYLNARGNCLMNVSVTSSGEYITSTVQIKLHESGDSSIVVTMFKE